jgi:hypothetical protein
MERKATMGASRIVGAVLLAIGAILLVFGFNASEAPLDRISETLTGRYTDRTMWYLILGAVGVVAGAVAMFASQR